MIQAKRILTVDNKTSRLDQPLTIYRGDEGIMLEIEIRNVKYRFNRTPSIEKFDNAFYKVTTLVAYQQGKKVIIPKKGMCSDGVVKIFISKEFVDQLDEVGNASMQFVLHSWQGDSITIPAFTIEIRKRIIDTEDDKEYYNNVISHNKRVFQHVNTVRKYGNVSGALSLSAEHQYQSATFNGNVAITAPTVTPTTVDEISLYFTCTVDGLNISFTNIDWDACGGLTQFQANTNYELILYPKDETHWLCTYKVYN